ncbi:lysosome-associated membrane glycoprotein 1-like isoform X2 [Engystomops pustulosus]|uniref:lysosome-associated membrane glycoprotein 1-like isoform X2 n=1 Tax=Engystomops pustulosus TaxID=76066 RepID=UPI003AFAE7F4
MGDPRKVIILCLYLQACHTDWAPAPTQRNTTPPCVWCKTTTHHTLHTATPRPTTHTNYISTPHTTTPTNNITTPHQTTHTKHTTTHTNHTTPHPTTHTNHTTPHPTTHTNHTTPHPTTHTNHTTPHPTTHTNHTTPHPTTHTNHTTPHPTTHTNHTTPHPTTHTNHTTSHLTTTYTPTTAPPTEYVVNGTGGICLRIMASFNISLISKTKQEIVIPSEPRTRASGNCSAQEAWLNLAFPLGQLHITFRQDTKDKTFFLREVNITLNLKDYWMFAGAVVKGMVTPLGRAFTCEKVDIEVTPNVSFSMMNVKAQAFKLEGGNYGKEMKCSSGSPNMTVPIVVGVILVVLILIVVIAYLVARRRNQRGYQPL